MASDTPILRADALDDDLDLESPEYPAATAQPANTVSVASYGADPTGVNDSTAAFNQAITAATTAGKAVWVPPGTFLISSPLQIKAGTIEGRGYIDADAQPPFWG